MAKFLAIVDSTDLVPAWKTSPVDSGSYAPTITDSQGKGLAMLEPFTFQRLLDRVIVSGVVAGLSGLDPGPLTITCTLPPGLPFGSLMSGSAVYGGDISSQGYDPDMDPVGQGIVQQSGGNALVFTTVSTTFPPAGNVFWSFQFAYLL